MITFSIEETNQVTNVSAYLALPDAGQGRGILLLHAWWGLNDFFKDLADRLAKEGFVVLAPDLFSGVTADTIAEAEQLVKSMDENATETTVKGAVDYLSRHSAVEGDTIAVMGFSLGAAWALLLATVFKPGDISATVVFYGNHPGLDEEDFSKAKSAFLGHFAADDPYEPEEDVRQTEKKIRQAGRSATFHFYPDTGHWFFESLRPDAYHPSAAQLAWQRTLDFLEQYLPQ